LLERDALMLVWAGWAALPRPRLTFRNELPPPPAPGLTADFRRPLLPAPGAGHRMRRGRASPMAGRSGSSAAAAEPDQAGWAAERALGEAGGPCSPIAPNGFRRPLPAGAALRPLRRQRVLLPSPRDRSHLVDRPPAPTPRPAATEGSKLTGGSEIETSRPITRRPWPAQGITVYARPTSARHWLRAWGTVHRRDQITGPVPAGRSARENPRLAARLGARGRAVRRPRGRPSPPVPLA